MRDDQTAVLDVAGPHPDGADDVWALLARLDVPLPDAGFVRRLRDVLVSHQHAALA